MADVGRRSSCWYISQGGYPCVHLPRYIQPSLRPSMGTTDWPVLFADARVQVVQHGVQRHWLMASNGRPMVPGERGAMHGQARSPRGRAAGPGRVPTSSSLWRGSTAAGALRCRRPGRLYRMPPAASNRRVVCCCSHKLLLLCAHLWRSRDR